jgi:hypothetical protein
VAAIPPPELLAAINSSASKYGLDPGTLIGIWRIESGGKYPNPYVNSSGYGGLFGTGQGSYLWSTQRQADYAAKILSGLIKSEGSLSAALLAYSGGAYSSVDGSGGDTPAGSGGSGGVVRPDTGGDTGGGSGGGLAGVPLVGGVFSAVGDVFGGLFGGLWHGLQSAGQAVVGIMDALLFFVHFVTSPDNWLRLVEFLLGAGLIVFAIAVYVRVFTGSSGTAAAATAAITKGAV